MGELIARAVTNNLYRFVVPAVAGPSRLVPLASLADEKAGITVTALRPRPSADASGPRSPIVESG